MTLRRVFTLLLPVWAVFLALLLGMILVWAAGVNPIRAYGNLFQGAFADVFGFATTLVKMTPLLFAGLGVATALRAGLYNIGAEGQIYMGGLAAAVVGLYVHRVPGILHVPLAMATAFVAGGLWAFPPIVLKLWRGVNEIITTLLMNYVAILLVSVIVSGPLMEPGAPSPYSGPLQPSAHLPVIIRSTDAHAGVLIALGLAVLLHLLFGRTRFGFQLRMVGANPSVAAYAGVNVPWTLVLAMVTGGGFAGLAGASEVMGLKHRLFDAFSPGYGYDAIVVAFLSNGQPIGVAVMALFLGALRSGANIMQRSMGIPVAIIFAIQGLAVLFLASSLALQRRLAFTERQRPDALDLQPAAPRS